jgi:glucose dehydrogenase
MIGRLLCLSILACAVHGGDAFPDTDWPHYQKDPFGTRYSTLAQINRANVQRLEVAWRYHAGGASSELKTSMECNPLVIGGVMYLTSPLLEIIALDAATGRELWRTDPFPPAPGRTTHWSMFSAVILVLGFASWIAGTKRARPSRSLMRWFLTALFVLGTAASLFAYIALRPAGSPKEERRLGPNRGLTYWKGDSQPRLYLAGGHRLVAVDAADGRFVSGFGHNGIVDLTRDLDYDVDGLLYTVSSPGVIYKDVIILGTKVAEGPKPAAPGEIRAFDLRTGRQRWVFHTIPRKGEPGSETWPNGDPAAAGGANAWAGLSLDSERGIVYAATGSPSFDLYGGDREGQNLYGDSVLALKADTGELVWHYQIVHHDLWDYDLPAPPALLTLHPEGRTRDVVVQIGKNAMLYVLDRDTGEPVIPIEERLVPTQPAVPGEHPFPVQPFPKWPPPLSRTSISEADLTDLSPEAHEYAKRILAALGDGHIYAPPTKRGTILTPGFHGGMNWNGTAWDPKHGRLIVNLNDLPYILTMRNAKIWQRFPYDFTGFNRFVDPEGYPAVRPPWGKLVALDLDRQEIAWQVPLGEYKELTARGIPVTGAENGGGAIITAGGLIFIGATKDEVFRAFDIDTGSELWEFQLNAAGYAIPSTYSVQGKQYVVIAAGGGGMAQTRSGDEYVAFALKD